MCVGVGVCVSQLQVVIDKSVHIRPGLNEHYAQL